MKDEQHIISLYHFGMSLKQISIHTGISVWSVRKILEKYNVTIRRTNKGIDHETVASMYKSGMSTHKISQSIGISVKMVCDILRKFNIERNNRYSNLNLDTEYWSTIDSADKAYFLGLLLADGCIYHGRVLSLELLSEDRDILELLSKMTGNTNKIGQRLQKNGKSTSIFRVSCKNWVIDLAKWGIVERKSKIAQIIYLDDNLMNHYIRGIFDGDGWFTRDHVLGFCGTEKLCTQIRDYLVDKLNVRAVKVNRGNTVHSVIWSSKSDYQKICRWMYQGAGSLKINRKYLKYLNFKSNVHGNPEIK